MLKSTLRLRKTLKIWGRDRSGSIRRIKDLRRFPAKVIPSEIAPFDSAPFGSLRTQQGTISSL
jgi:hypothetical protein